MSFKNRNPLFALMLLAGTVAVAQNRSGWDPPTGGFHGRNPDRPFWVDGNVLRAEVKAESGVRGLKLDVLDALDVHRAHIESVYVIAASRMQMEGLGLELNGRALANVSLNSQLQLIEIPVNRNVSRSLDRLELVGRGVIYVAEVGAIATRVSGGNPGPGPGPGHPPGGRDLIEFRGAYEQVDVSFEGRSRTDIQASCLEFMKGRNFNYVDDIKLFTTSAKLSAYLSHQTFCAWAALNARSVRRAEPPFKTDLVYEGLPFEIRVEDSRDVEELKLDIESLAASVQINYVDDLKRDGIAFKTSNYLTTTTGARAFLLANLPLMNARLKAVGHVERFPIRLEGYSRDEIRNDCLKVMSLTGLQYIDDVEVNGKASRSSHYLDAQEICMIVSTNAQ
jgi:hypothetical protein